MTETREGKATIIPTIQRIQKLYALESRAHGAFTTAAKELGKVRGDAESDYWTVTLPQAIFDFLDSMSHDAAVAACKGFLTAFDRPMDELDPCEGCGTTDTEHAENCREVCAHEWPSDIHEEGGDHYCGKCGADGLA